MSTLVSPLAMLGAIRRRTTSLVLLLTMVAAALVGPSVVAPRMTDPASAAVYNSCAMSRCADARTARSGWSAKGFPTSCGWYSWSGGMSNFAGGRFYNYEGQLPTNATYYEYDVYPRNQGVPGTHTGSW